MHCVTRRGSFSNGLFIGEKSFKIFLSIEICFTSPIPSFMVQIQLNLKVPGLFRLLYSVGSWLNTQLFLERLSGKVHATIPEGIVGGFELTVLQRNVRIFASAY